MKTLIVGHSQVKYFKNYVSLPDTECLSYCGCRIEDLLREPEVRRLIPESQVRLLFVYLNVISRFYCIAEVWNGNC